MNISKDMQTKICIGIIVAATVASLILGIGYFVRGKQDKTEQVSITEMNKPSDEKVVITVDTQVIEDGLINMGFLVTQEYYFTNVETYTKEKKVLKFFDATSELAYSYDGYVTAGVDFEKIRVIKDEDTKTITVEVPDAEIQTVYIDKDSFQVFTEKESMWNKMDVTDFNDSLKEFEKAAKEKALESGILERANEQAEALVYNFLNNSQNVKNYRLELH